ncbi:MAG: tetratricopeptide repeat protein [Wenzhouxiangellaceae bacterium]
MKPLWAGDERDPGQRKLYTPQYYAENLSPRLTHGWGELRVLYEGDHKYIHGPRPELYDLAADPDELANLIAEDPVGARRLREELAVFIREHAAEQAATTQALEPELVSRLQSLGYLHGSGAGGEEIREVLHDEGIAPQDRVSDLNRMSAAKHLLFKGRPGDALNYTSKLVATGGDSPVYRELHAAALAGVGRLNESWEIASELQATGVVSESLVLTLAAQRFEQGDRAAAVEFLERFSGNKDSARALWLLSSLYRRIQDHQRALETLQEALSLEPDFVPARVDLAIHWARNEQRDRAEAEFRLALSQNPYYAKSSYNYGAFLVEVGRLEEASAYFRRTLDLAPTHLKAHLALITVQHLTGDHEAARATLSSLRQIAPDSPEATMASDLLSES